MTPDTPSPATEAWILPAVKDLHSEQWHGLTYDQMIAQGVAIIARHHASQPVAPTARPSQLAAPDVAALATEIRYLKEYVIPEKDKHGKYWHDLAQERVARLSEMTTERDNWRDTAKRTDAALSALVAERDAYADEKRAINAALNKTDSRGVNEIEQIEWLSTALTASREREGKLREALKDARTVAYKAPELNMSNYDHGQVRDLNDAMIELFQVLDAALLTPPPAGTEEKG